MNAGVEFLVIFGQALLVVVTAGSVMCVYERDTLSLVSLTLPLFCSNTPIL